MNGGPANRRGWRTAELVLILSTILVLPAWGQTDTGGIEGVVRDATGGVLPGVTVEVTSPALIEGTRATVTEATGNYRFLRLPVGTYKLTFSLPGFGTVERGNIVINSGFTATINADLAVGGVAETLTVTGESPLVDVRGTTTQLVVTDEVINTIPSSRNVMDIGKLIVGFSTGSPEVGGSLSQNYGTGWQIHGNRSIDRSYWRDGLPSSSYFSGGDAPMSYGGTGLSDEVNFQTTALPASVPVGGMVMMLVSKSGGNILSGTVFVSGFVKALQSSNLDDNLRSLGVKATSGGTKAYDVDLSSGGPIRKDKIWFFGDARVWSYTELLANQFWTDGSQMESYVRRTDYFGKVTWQVSQTNKISVSNSREGIYRPFRRSGATFVMPEAANFNTQDPFNRFVTGTWTGTPSNDWIFEIRMSNMSLTNRERYRPEVEPGAVPRLDIATSTLSGAPTRIREGHPYRTVFSGSVTHVANWLGSHEIQTGAQYDFGGYETTNDFTEHGDITLRFRNGTPDSADLLNSPVHSDNKGRQVGLYVQDRWMIANRLTVNVGVRYDDIHIYYPDQHAGAGAWVPERDVPGVDAKTWRTVVPRLGVAYDLTGRAKTVLKGSFSKYMGNEGVGLAESLNPIFLQTNRCAWTDANGDLYAQPFELSRCAGWGGGTTTTQDPSLRRPFNREYSLGIEHQLADNLRISVMYNRRENRDNRGIVNRAVPTVSYIPVTITNPLTNEPLTIYNQHPATAGLQDNLLTNLSELDTTYNGVDIAFQRRFGGKGQLQGGYSYGKIFGLINTVSTGAGTASNVADPTDPNNLIFGRGEVGNSQPHQFKLSGSYVLPGDLSVSGSFAANSGNPRVRRLNVGRALVPGLTRATQTVNLEPNDANRYDRWVMLDLRVGRIFRVGNLRFEPFADAYNLLNRNTILSEVTTVGSSLGNVSSTINPRVVRIGGKFTF